MSRLRFNLLIVGLVGILCFFQYRLWFESGGIIDMLKLKKAVLSQTQVNEKLKAKNAVLQVQIESLKQSDDADESRARSELGMIKKGETFYQVVK